LVKNAIIYNETNGKLSLSTCRSRGGSFSKILLNVRFPRIPQLPDRGRLVREVKTYTTPQSSSDLDIDDNPDNDSFFPTKKRNSVADGSDSRRAVTGQGLVPVTMS
jgi:hypothetical protein